MKKSSSVAFLVALGLVSSLSYGDSSSVTAGGDSTSGVGVASQSYEESMKPACSGLSKEDLFTMGNGDLNRFGNHSGCWNEAITLGWYGDLVMRITNENANTKGDQFRFVDLQMLVDIKLAPGVSFSKGKNQSFVRFMDPELSPAYAKIGKQNLSFGHYSGSNNIAFSNKMAVGLGILPIDGFYASGEIYVPSETKAKKKTTYNGYDAKVGYMGSYDVNDGANLDYRFELSYISDVNDLPGYVLNLPLPVLNTKDGVDTENATPFNVASGDVATYDLRKADSKVYLNAKPGYLANIVAVYDDSIYMGLGYGSAIGSSIDGKFGDDVVSLSDHIIQAGVGYKFSASGLKNEVEAYFDCIHGKMKLGEENYYITRHDLKGVYKVWLSDNLGLGFTVHHITNKGDFANYNVATGTIVRAEAGKDNKTKIVKDGSSTFEATLDLEFSA